MSIMLAHIPGRGALDHGIGLTGLCIECSMPEHGLEDINR